MKTILFLLLSTVVKADQVYDQYFTTKAGRILPPAEAILASTKGEAIYKCTSVEFKVSKAGTSIGLHSIKKPKVEKQ